MFACKNSDYVWSVKKTKTDNADATESNWYLKLWCVLPAVLSDRIMVLGHQKIMYLPTKLMFIQSALSAKKIANFTLMKTSWHHKHSRPIWEIF